MTTVEESLQNQTQIQVQTEILIGSRGRRDGFPGNSLKGQLRGSAGKLPGDRLQALLVGRSIKRSDVDISRGQSGLPSSTLQPAPPAAFRLGEKGSGLRTRGSVQDFCLLRDECLADKTLFEDPDFPAEDSSIFFSKSSSKTFEWKRPKEIVEDPQLFVEGASRFDVQQGELGNCWLVAALTNLTLNPSLLVQVVPDDQDFTEKYAGIFHFKFWQYGRWIDVVIDDRLPTRHNQLAFMHSSENNEFWSALLEKAYAKLHGSYEALKGGTSCEAMEDFTGGVTEIFEIRNHQENLFKIMQKAYERSSLMGCSIEADARVSEARTPEGLVKGHAYSITKVKLIQIPGVEDESTLIRLRNPWGNEVEWNGSWSDKSPEWLFISDKEREEIGLTINDDGEFWMCYQDFSQHFHRIEICNLNPTTFIENNVREERRKWEVSLFEGDWIKGVTAGGCRNYLETFWRNPQYRVTLQDPDEDDDDDNCTLIVALMQKNRRSQRKMGVEVLTIGFTIYILPDPDNLPKPLTVDFFNRNQSVARSPSYVNLREVSCRFKLPPGVYCIIPSTFEPNEEGEFVLRVFSETKNNMQENDMEVGIGEVDNRIKEVLDSEEQRTHEKAKEFFLKIAGDDMEIDWMELQDILIKSTRKEASKECFSKDVCRAMVALMDIDKTGKLGYEEFKTLWTDVRQWKNVFKLYDQDGSGCLDGFELREALNSAGYHLNNHILSILVHRYGNKNGTMSFDDFMMCAIKLKSMILSFKEKEIDSSNEALFTMEEWLEKTLYS